MSYLRDPKAIYDQSFAAIRREADLSGFSAHEQDLVIRLVHACGMPDIVDDLKISPNAVEKGIAAMAAGAPIICDVNMVAKGVIKRKLMQKNPVLCGLDLQAATDFASQNKHTRTAGGIDALSNKISGAIIAIGNAPTALFYLLELVEKTGAKPAIILGFPVGFVGAVESKAELIANRFELEFIVLAGRRGGSAFAAAALNALAAGLDT